MYFLELPCFMNKQTTSSIRTKILFKERLTEFRFILDILIVLVMYLIITMSELAFRAISTLSCLYPIFAHFSFVFCFINLFSSAIIIDNLILIFINSLSLDFKLFLLTWNGGCLNLI